jgi:hypothetical protein
MSVTQSAREEPAAKLLPWAATLTAYLVASGIQIAVYGVAASAAGGSLGLPDWAYSPFILIWLFAPATFATWVSARFLRAIRKAGHRLAMLANLTLLLSAPLSIYLGVSVSFNTWGT